MHIEAAGRQISFGGRNGALVVARDISGRRISEAKVRAAEEKFRAAFQNAPTGMAIVDKAGMFLDVNAALARLFGRRVATLHGDLIWHHLHPDDSERVRGDFARVVEGPRTTSPAPSATAPVPAATAGCTPRCPRWSARSRTSCTWST